MENAAGSITKINEKLRGKYGTEKKADRAGKWVWKIN